MVVACPALFLTGTGTGVAVINALPAGSVGTAQLKANAVVSSKVKDHSLKAVDFAAAQLPKGEKGDAGATGATGASGATHVVKRYATGPTSRGFLGGYRVLQRRRGRDRRWHGLRLCITRCETGRNVQLPRTLRPEQQHTYWMVRRRQEHERNRDDPGSGLGHLRFALGTGPVSSDERNKLRSGNSGLIARSGRRGSNPRPSRTAP